MIVTHLLDQASYNHFNIFHCLLPFNQILIHHADCREPPLVMSCWSACCGLVTAHIPCMPQRRQEEGARAVRKNGKDDPSLESVGTRKHCHSVCYKSASCTVCYHCKTYHKQQFLLVGEKYTNTSPQKCSWNKVATSAVQKFLRGGSPDNIG